MNGTLNGTITPYQSVQLYSADHQNWILTVRCNLVSYSGYLFWEGHYPLCKGYSQHILNLSNRMTYNAKFLDGIFFLFLFWLILFSSRLKNAINIIIRYWKIPLIFLSDIEKCHWYFYHILKNTIDIFIRYWKIPLIFLSDIEKCYW